MAAEPGANAPRLVVVNNLPTPYRSYTFGALHDEMERRGFRLEVMYMASGESGRYWTFSPEDWRYTGRVVGGLHMRLRGTELHLNPGIWLDFARRPPAWLLVAGSWHYPSILGLYLMRPWSRRRTAFLAWAEANHRASRYSGGAVGRLRRALFSSADGLVIPGRIARETITEHWAVRAPRFFQLPNLVDEAVFRDKVAAQRPQQEALRRRHGIPEDRRVLFWSARLKESDKGILNFLQAVEPLLGSVTILIAGEGPDRPTVEHWLGERPHVDVRLKGHMPQNEIVECLALSDAALLPSLRDPNPLTIIEALWAALPVYASVNCGNWPETIHHGENGWLVDPSDPQNLRDCFAALMACSQDQLAAMGQQSLAIAGQEFDSRLTISRFMDALVAAFPPHAPGRDARRSVEITSERPGMQS